LALSSSLGLLLICSCNGLNKEGKYEINSSLFMGCDTILKGKKIGVKDLPLYKIDTSFYTFLDSIVVSES